MRVHINTRRILIVSWMLQHSNRGCTNLPHENTDWGSWVLLIKGNGGYHESKQLCYLTAIAGAYMYTMDENTEGSFVPLKGNCGCIYLHYESKHWFSELSATMTAIAGAQWCMKTQIQEAECYAIMKGNCGGINLHHESKHWFSELCYYKITCAYMHISIPWIKTDSGSWVLICIYLYHGSKLIQGAEC
jgi:hypothetical protein